MTWKSTNSTFRWAAKSQALCSWSRALTAIVDKVGANFPSNQDVLGSVAVQPPIRGRSNSNKGEHSDEGTPGKVILHREGVVDNRDDWNSKLGLQLFQLGNNNGDIGLFAPCDQGRPAPIEKGEVWQVEGRKGGGLQLGIVAIAVHKIWLSSLTLKLQPD